MTTVEADLSFELEREGQEPLRGTVRGRDSDLVLDINDASAVAGAGDARTVRQAARTLSGYGLRVRVVESGRHLITLGAVHVPWWQRPFTRSRHIRIGSWRGALTGAKAQAGGQESVLPTTAMLPPPTLWPLVPTMRTRSRSGAATTHSGGGAARLVVLRPYYLPGEQQLVVWLQDGLTIGSGEDAGLRLPGTEPLHAVVHHDEDDEWVIEAVAGTTRVHGAPVERQLLRTGARVEIGEHQLTYFREEYADHGRPYGGRIGGELGRQRPQAPRRNVR